MQLANSNNNENRKLVYWVSTFIVADAILLILTMEAMPRIDPHYTPFLKDLGIFLSPVEYKFFGYAQYLILAILVYLLRSRLRHGYTFVLYLLPLLALALGVLRAKIFSHMTGASEWFDRQWANYLDSWLNFDFYNYYVFPMLVMTTILATLVTYLFMKVVVK